MVIALFLIGGLVGLYYGAEWLVKGSSSLALRFGVAPLVVGLTVVAFGTSAPEMVVSVAAALDGFGSIAIGNVIGSNIINIAVILGISALVRPLPVNLKVLKVDTPIMLGASILFIWFMRDQMLQRWEGALLFAGILVYITLTIYLGKKSGKAVPPNESPLVGKELTGSTLFDILFILAGLSGLVLGSHLFVKGTVDLAIVLGVSQAVIALTVVSLGTSLPELATTVVASFKKQEDIALGNIIGSNIFNLLAILGASGLVAPLKPVGIGPVDMMVMLGISVLLLPMMRFRPHIGRLEGAFFLLAYAAYMVYLWPGVIR